MDGWIAIWLDRHCWY